MKTISLPYTIETSIKTLMGVGVSEMARFDAGTEYLPWRGLAVTLLS